MVTYRQVWAHKKSGERFAVEIDDRGHVVYACGPLHHKELVPAMNNGFDNDPEVAQDLEKDQDSYRIV